jgi:hypothetical protein
MKAFLERRSIGVVYLVYFVTAFASVRGGSMLAMISTGIYGVLVVLFARMFWRLNVMTSAAMLVAGLGGCALQVYGIASGFKASEYAALSLFGAFCVVLGYLLVSSKLVPTALGVLLALAGIGWLTFLVPTFALRIAPYTEGLGGLAEIVLMLWLLFRGIPVPLRD